jgi:hypothetical protein
MHRTYPALTTKWGVLIVVRLVSLENLVSLVFFANFPKFPNLLKFSVLRSPLTANSQRPMAKLHILPNESRGAEDSGVLILKA